MHHIPDTEFIKTPNYKVLTLTRMSRPTTQFVNVGSAFMNARDLAKRQVVSQHNSRIRSRKILKRKAVHLATRQVASQHKSRITRKELKRMVGDVVKSIPAGKNLKRKARF